MNRHPISAFYLLLSAFFLDAGLPAVLHAVDFSEVPGVVLDYNELDYWQYGIIERPTPGKFVSDNDIVVLPDGKYIASHAWSGWDTSADSSGETKLFRSADGGVNWTSLGTKSGITRASLFVHNGALYLFGAKYEGGEAVIMKSTDSGTTWTSASFSFTGPGTPNNPVIWSNRWWSAGGTYSYFIPVASNLFTESAWARGTGFPDETAHPEWLSEGEIITEGQIVASPELGVFILPKVKQHAYTALCKVSPEGDITFDPVNHFMALPGGEKKFGAAYDPGSGKFFVLSNPILPAHAGASEAPDMIRNTAAVLSSRDLFNWKVEKIFLYSTYISAEGFGYLNFDFDDTNMVVVSRTAYRVPGEKYPERGHDSNLLTFHRIDDFRNLSPDQILKISDGQVLRYERTQHASAPLGSFTLGNTFAGAALTNPDGIGRTGAGDVYIRESGGRILHFDVLGNFIETNSSSPVAFSDSQISARQPANGECAWLNPGSGSWSDLSNWYYWGRPDTTEEIAVFGSAATAAATVTVPPAAQTWSFNSDGDKEGWSVSYASDSAVAGGVLQGTADTSADWAQIYRNDQFFYGSTVPEVRLRMKADANCTVYFYWRTALANSYSSVRRLAVAYTNNGDFQNVTFSTAGHSGWDGQAITRLRFVPLVQTNASRGFAVDSITMSKESYRLKGLRFRSAKPYTLSGGRLRIGTEDGDGSVEVMQGKHTNDVELLLGSDTDITLTNGTSLHLKKGIDLNGKVLHVTGRGRLLIQDSLVMNGGTLITGEGTPLVFTNNTTGSVLNGTLQFLPEDAFVPAAGARFELLENPDVLGSRRFSGISLPELPAGLKWNTNTLYSAGDVSVEAEQCTLTVATSRGNSSPPAGINTYDYGTVLTAELTGSPVANGTTTQFVCRGWSGTGSVPAGGTSTNTGSFSLTSGSTITWLWSTNYWLTATATAGGSLSVTGGWVGADSNVLITASPAAHYRFAQWTGQTNGCTINSSAINIPMNGARTITAEFVPDVFSLTVATPHGNASPAAGTGVYTSGTGLTATVTSPVANGMSTQYVCRGWSGTGSVPAGGTSANTGSFILTADSTITWLWSTNYWLETEATAGGRISASVIAGVVSETLIKEGFDWGSGVQGRESVTNGQNIHGMAVSDYGTNLWTMYGVSSADSAAKFNGSAGLGSGSVSLSGTGTVLCCAYTNLSEVSVAAVTGTYTPYINGTRRFAVGFQTAGASALLGAGTDDSIVGDIDASGNVLLRAKINGTNYFPGVTNRFSSFTGGDTVTMVLTVNKVNENAVLLTRTSLGSVTNTLDFSPADAATTEFSAFAVNVRSGTIILDSVSVVPDTSATDSFDWGAGVRGRESFTNGQSISGSAVSGSTNIWTMYGVSSANSAAVFSGAAGTGNGSVTISGTGTVLRCAYTDWSNRTVTAVVSGAFTPYDNGSTRRFCCGFQTSGAADLLAAGSYDSICADINNAGNIYLRAKIDGAGYWMTTTNSFGSFNSGDAVTMILTVDKVNENATLLTTTASGTVTNFLDFSAADAATTAFGEFAVNVRYGSVVLDSVNIVSEAAVVSKGWEPANAGVQLTAAADPYYHFTGWSGDTAASSPQIILLMNHAYSVTAGFAPNVTENTGTPEQWLAQYGFTNYSANAMEDADHDGLLTWQEYIAGTDPTDPVSSLRVASAGTKSQGIVIRWPSVSNRLYSLSRTTNLQESFTFVAGATNIPATPPENIYTNQAQSGTVSYYRINVCK